MKTGLLWYDDDRKLTLREHVERACAHYEQKWGQMPNLCYVHPSALKGTRDTLTVGPVEVETRSTVLKHCVWVGRELKI